MSVKTPKTLPPSAARHAASGDFVQDSQVAFDRLSEAVRKVIAAIPSPTTRPADLARVLDLDYALAWQIHALAGQPDLHMTARVVPRPGSMERFLLAAQRVEPKAATTARTAYEAFERVVIDLSGDRDAFDAVLTLQRPDDGAGLRRARRAAHRANAAVWGVTCKAKIQTAIFRARPSGEFDSLVVVGYVGLQRLHPDAIVTTLASTRTWGSNGPPTDGPRAEIACSLIEEACTQPLPAIEHAVAPDGSKQEFLALDGLGRRSESTIFWRSSALNVPDATIAPPHTLSSTCRVPTELLVLHLLLPRGTAPTNQMAAWMAPDPGRYADADPTTRHRLPYEGMGKYVGHTLSSLRSAAAPEHAEVMRAEIARIGWADTEFDIFRCEVQYPVLHSAVHLRIG